MLRLEARARAGEPVREIDASRHRNFMRRLAEEDVVVAYDPHSAAGFRLVPRLPDDDDIVRRPRVGLTAKRRAD
ncbi:hypothetical protein [Blastococcus sp. TF02A-26]|uniref:hypothetical protein n=1 Tax=Blastococcus sp. TF02A-26 TaxID=2250577 RepID=UPI0018F5B247|nr:hypothetical protein [Blastococcus sp. TF02A-26]